MAKRKRELVPRQRTYTRHIMPRHKRRKCKYCNMNLPKQAINRKAHTDVCMAINVSTLHTTEERQDEVVHVDRMKLLEDDHTPDDVQDKDAWMADDTNDDFFIDDEEAGTNLNYEGACTSLYGPATSTCTGDRCHLHKRRRMLRSF
jgi:hypothetical protein